MTARTHLIGCGILCAASLLIIACSGDRAPTAGRCDGLPVERFDEYQADGLPPHPWRTDGLGEGVRLLLDPSAESPFVANRISGKGLLLTDGSATAGAEAGVETRFPAPPQGPLFLSFDAQTEGMDLECRLATAAAPVLTVRLGADGVVTCSAPGQPPAQGRLPAAGWSHCAIRIAADGAVQVSAVQGSRQSAPVALASLPAATRAQPTALAFRSGWDPARTGSWRLDNICMAGDVLADRRTVWPFEQAPLADLRASPRKVFAYYFPIYGNGMDREDPGLAWYQRIRLNPTWAADSRPDRKEAGAELLYTPLPQPPLAAGTSATAALERSAEAEIVLAGQLGLDGFLLDFQAFPNGKNGESFFQRRSFAILDAAARVDPGFRILPAVYSNSGKSGINGEADAGRSPDSYAASPVLQRLADHPATLRLPDGRMALSMWLSECHSAAWWRAVIDALAARGIRVALFPQFNSYGRLADFAPIAEGMNHWGPRTPEPYDWISRVRPLTRTAIQTICFQDVRTRGATYWESGASRTFRGLWSQAIAEKADWTFIQTWSDYTEQAQAPSTAIGFAIHDLNAYYLQWFKAGAPPAIRRDALYYVHRRFHSATTPRLGAVWTRRGQQPVEDAIEVLAFLTAPGEIEIAVDGRRSVHQAPAGLSVVSAPLPAARDCVPVLRLRRDGAEVLRGASRHAVLAQAEFQDPLYHAGSIHGLEEVP